MSRSKMKKIFIFFAAYWQSVRKKLLKIDDDTGRHIGKTPNYSSPIIHIPSLYMRGGWCGGTTLPTVNFNISGCGNSHRCLCRFPQAAAGGHAA